MVTDGEGCLHDQADSSRYVTYAQTMHMLYRVWTVLWVIRKHNWFHVGDPKENILGWMTQVLHARCRYSHPATSIKGKFSKPWPQPEKITH